MTVLDVLAYLGVWGAFGCVAFSLFVVLAFRTGMVWTARDPAGALKERIPLKGYLAMLTVPVGVISLLVLANCFGLPAQVGFFALFLLNFGHYLILFVYDTLVIDGLVLSVWRPDFLQLPEAIGWESMKEHIVLSLPVGPAVGAGLAVVGTAISYFFLL